MAMAVFKKRYIDVSFGQLHAVEAGDGEPVLLLHASPLSGAFLTGQLNALAEAGFHAIAIDTPGYGQSDPLPTKPTSLEDYAAAFLEALDGMHTRHVRVYGTATGAQLALAIARLAPDRVIQVVVDNCALFTQAEVDAWEQGYFPDLSPSHDGAHWAKAWEIAAGNFKHFPWHIHSPETAINVALPPASFITQMAVHYVIAKPSFDVCYRLAFHAENAKSFEGLDVATTLVDWEGSIVRRQVQALIAQGLPEVVKVVTAGPTPLDRYQAMVNALSAES
jgi:pimeloyl-ACP methyl ester carboxylesterase